MVAAQIAAGEVVERPASVVKELVENALDAGAQRITVSVRRGGIEEIVVQDNGSGIPADELEVAFARHATSKLTSTDDLWAIHTLGFRGEALPSIAAVAQVICQSRTADAATGAELRVAGGEVQHMALCGGAPGTTFTIRNLFYNVPVRREFLKSTAAEAAAIAGVITQYALAYPQVAFTLVRDDKRVFQTSGHGQLADVILELYGVEVARQMIAVEARVGEDIGEVQIRGMVSAPSVTRSARDGMHITVNGRAIAPRGQMAAIVEEAYHTLVMKGRFPIVVLHIQVHPAAVDVNVHPTKSEVKFRNAQLVAHTLGRAVRDAVQETVVIQGWRDPTAPDDPREQPSVPVSVEIDPAARLAVEQTPLANDAADTLREPASPDPPSHTIDRPAGASVADPVEPARAMPPAPMDPSIQRPPIQATLLEEFRDDTVAQRRWFDRPADAAWADPTSDRAGEHPVDVGVGPSAALEQRRSEGRVRETPAPFVARDLAPTPEEASAPTPDNDAPVMATTRAPGLPRLRALAQLGLTYLLTEGPDGALYLIDQHAAHERITYERLLAQHDAGVVQSQALLLPQQVDLPPDAQQTLLAAANELAAWGFALGMTGGGVQVQAMPVGLAIEVLATTLADLASHLGGSGGNTVAGRRDALLATLACHTSVRAGQPLALVEQQALIDQLSSCEGPRTCPHGRPTVIVITRNQLERQFGRLGA